MRASATLAAAMSLLAACTSQSDLRGVDVGDASLATTALAICPPEPCTPDASAAWAWRRRRWPGLRDKGVQVHVLETAAAIELYNELGRDQAVGGLFTRPADWRPGNSLNSTRAR